MKNLLIYVGVLVMYIAVVESDKICYCKAVDAFDDKRVVHNFGEVDRCKGLLKCLNCKNVANQRCKSTCEQRVREFAMAGCNGRRGLSVRSFHESKLCSKESGAFLYRCGRQGKGGGGGRGGGGGGGGRGGRGGHH
ncbi:hypothetical protein ScPMuIL_010113 [Solemya velum]